MITCTDLAAMLRCCVRSHVKRAGKPRGAHDLIVAASPVATGRSVLTTDSAANWNDLPGVTAVHPC